MKLPIDLRSDTVTKPSLEMRKAIFEAEVGDDVFGEDPTVNKLQEKIAEMFKMDAALFVPSGTMANQIAARVYCKPGEEILVEKNCHIVLYEGGGISANSGIHLSTLDGYNGMVPIDILEKNIKPDDPHFPRTKLLWLENTHNQSGGKILPLDYIREVSELAFKYDLKLHLDGARLFNAIVATDTKPQDYSELVDSLSICFSKGLGAPIGSILIGTKDFINEAKRVRKMLGGGMRQVGIIAAAALYAIENNINRLKEDHIKAKFLADNLKNIEELQIEDPQTNIIHITINSDKWDAKSLVDMLKEEGVYCLNLNDKTIRLVTHLDINQEQLEYVIDVFNWAFKII